MRVEGIVFLSLVLDLFAFTIPLPLFPRIIEWYTKREGSDPSGFLSQTLGFITAVRSTLFTGAAKNPQKWDVVLLGGLMGSVFSFISPYIGALSDKYGRKRILLITMIGNILSALIWIQSTTFASYLLSRVVGGLSEGNVQLAIAILSDITTPQNRGKALAHVGIAFAICFIIGPPIGAWFASKPLPSAFRISGVELNVYATPALLSLVLLVLETIFLACCSSRNSRRPKTAQANGTVKDEKTNGTANGKTNGKANGNGHAAPRKASVAERLELLKKLRLLHFSSWPVFSGVEFTLTFLTYDLFDWDNKQNGALIGSIGVVSALVQGGYVRRAIAKIGEGKMASRGIASCWLGLLCLSVVPRFVTSYPSLSLNLLRAAAVCMAFTSATVVNSLTSYASLQCDEGAVDEDTGKISQEHPELAKGKALGKFRSSGQLGRAIGPLLACGLYWTFGPAKTYAGSSALMYGVYKLGGSLAAKAITS
ncbi:hypothetical protein QCA50_000564 [Cerrena zonata]|uniref:Uncharacterized protein n=1 Tax=Cerrena zonata TaxID=2478898 RepID=A0AAW0GRR8_9APHY